MLLVAAGVAYGYWALVHVPNEAAVLLKDAEDYAAKVADAAQETDPEEYRSDFEEAVKLFRKVAVRYEFTPTSGEAEIRANAVEVLFAKRLKDFDRDTRAFADAAAGQRDLIRDQFNTLNWEDGTLVQEIDDAIAKFRDIAKAAEVIATLEGWKKEITTYGATIDAELARAATAIGSGDLAGAWRLLRRLRNDPALALKRKLPTKWATIVFPLQVHSTPPGATVTIDDRAVPGNTPTPPLQHQLGRRLLIAVSHRGYVPQSRTYVVGDTEEGPTAKFKLKLATWYDTPHVINTPFNLSNPLVAAAGGVMGATDNGYVIALAPLSAKMAKAGPNLRLKKENDPQKNSPTGPPAVQGDLCVCNRKDGTVLFFSRTTAAPKYEYRLFDANADHERYRGEEPVGAPVIDTARSLVFVTSTLGRIHAARIADGARAWVNAPFGDATPRLTQPAITEGYVIAGTDHGWLVGLSAESEEQERGQHAFRFQVAPDARITHPPAAIAGGLITVATSRGEASTLYAYNLTKNRADRTTLTGAWQQSYELRGSPVGPPIMLTQPVQAVIVGVTEGRGGRGRVLALTMLGGDWLWTEYPDGVKTQPQLQQPAIYKSRLYVLASGRLTAHDVTTGRLSHTLQLDKQALPRFGPTVTQDGHVIAVLRKGAQNLLYTVRE